MLQILLFVGRHQAQGKEARLDISNKNGGICMCNVNNTLKKNLRKIEGG
jgi:hypothetical protein